MNAIIIVLMPLAWLLLTAGCASVLGYGLLQVAGDVFPLHKTVSKLTLILLLVGVFPLRKALRLNWHDFGFAPASIFFRQMGSGLLLGLATLLPVLVVLYGFDVQIWDSSRAWTPAKVAEKAAVALFFALLIAVGEELLFRGLLLSSLRRRLPLLAAIGCSSFYYAALHFLKTKTEIPYQRQTLASGFELMLEAFSNWLNPAILSALLALFVVGVFLAVLRTRVPESLGLCIGCHAGWVWEIKLSKDLFNVNPQSDYLYLVSTYDGVVGPLVSVWLGLVVAVWLMFRKQTGV
jgi:uncharacterized protein